MNHRHVLANLEEAAEELNRTVEALRRPGRYSEGELHVALQHVYHHINFAWNGRLSTRKRSRACSARDFKAWGQYPRTIKPLSGALPNRVRRTGP
jgi:hypothetical protein